MKSLMGLDEKGTNARSESRGCGDVAAVCFGTGGLQ